MNYTNLLNIPKGRAICYSGFRDGQQPGGPYPTYEQVKEDLLILSKNWNYLRLYDVDPHAETVLQVIANEGLDFKVMQGVYINAEKNNFGCPWGGGVYSEEELDFNRSRNELMVQKLIKLANQYADIICCTSAGNEACVDWTDHYVPVDRVIEFVKIIKANTKQPVTFCENYVPWYNKLKPLAEVIDFISIHTYPVWEYKHIHEGLEYTKQNYYSVAELYPDKPVVITEAGWATKANGLGIEPHNVSEELQAIYYNDLVNWCEEDDILCFVFEAFDEPWKGSSDIYEPEKHWGLFYENRQPKLVMQSLYSYKTD